MRLYGHGTSGSKRSGASARRFLASAAVVVMLGLLPVAISPRLAVTQEVNLVKVDVSVVGKGLRASKLAGNTVVNDKNETIGKLDDIIVGPDRSLFAVLQVGGFLGLGSRLVAVPYDSLHIEEKDGKVEKVELPGASRDQLKQLAEFR
jgi:sporulation protein YlmC with PRC-barrel domain